MSSDAAALSSIGGLRSDLSSRMRTPGPICRRTAARRRSKAGINSRRANGIVPRQSQLGGIAGPKLKCTCGEHIVCSYAAVCSRKQGQKAGQHFGNQCDACREVYSILATRLGGRGNW